MFRSINHNTPCLQPCAVLKWCMAFTYIQSCVIVERQLKTMINVYPNVCSWIYVILGVKKKLLLVLIVFNNFFTNFTDDIQIVVIHSRGVYNFMGIHLVP